MLLANLGYLFFLLNAKHVKLCKGSSFIYKFFWGGGGVFFFFFLGRGGPLASCIMVQA